MEEQQMTLFAIDMAPRTAIAEPKPVDKRSMFDVCLDAATRYGAGLAKRGLPQELVCERIKGFCAGVGAVGGLNADQKELLQNYARTAADDVLQRQN